MQNIKQQNFTDRHLNFKKYMTLTTKKKTNHHKLNNIQYYILGGTISNKGGYYYLPSTLCTFFGVIVSSLCDENMNLT